MNTYAIASQVQLSPLEVSIDTIPFLSILVTPAQSQTSSPHIQMTAALSFSLVCKSLQSILHIASYSSNYVCFNCSSPPRPSESGWSLISPSRAAATTCPLSSVNIPALNPYPSAQTPPPVSSVFCIYVNLLAPDEFWEHIMGLFGFCLFLMMPRERHKKSKQYLWNWIKLL